MENKRSEFKKLLEEMVIPEVMSYEEREPLLKPLLEYVRIADTYKTFTEGTLADEKVFCAVIDIAKIKEQDFILTPGRYVGIAEQEQDAEPFEEKMSHHTGELATLFEQSHTLETEIKKQLESIEYKL